ncbi:NAD-dependent deacetylase hst3 [Fusarium irregulare]|uniref:NAD-dependent deacetylase hst3 n=1 Tax=Fusarium irregulare TaxID=2494466 RepID=A0A9W8U4G4_9HYPO|nr:NAD-dependent deacetylase hst3 [Fusarium irregulare]KAJ4028851.1 NAD-dependent deacetylase hst3 [Fusarium irregulare]
MPTTHVSPESQDELREIANGLLKARKVIVVTGAGISTNSGIPDFRSENGLYSLISAQFDAATQQARLLEGTTDDKTSDSEARPALKRRKVVRDELPEPEEESGEMEEEIEVQLEDPEPVEEEKVADTIQVEGDIDDEMLPDDSQAPLLNPRTTRSTIAIPTSPLSSPPPEDFRLTPPAAFRRTRRNQLNDSGIPPSSSPLSSPPPVLFEPFSSHATTDDGPSSRSSTSPSEVDDTPPSNPSLSQTNLGAGKNTLPNMKGKDMFDASIWSDPLRTSVFYTFATTLRQKVRNVEPTSSHKFISHLRDRGKLVRCYTQNIDQIEEKVGLSTRLDDGPGSRGRFSRKSTANLNQLNRMVDEVNAMTEANSDKSQQSSDNEASQQSQSSQSRGDLLPASQAESDHGASEDAMIAVQNLRRDLPKSGVECVFLHGSLELLRCFLCGRVCSWDDDGRQLETMSGQQPECPHCVGATVAREERGKRALGVGKLRPDIVLYGEEHPNAHLISPIVTHDLALCPDLLLILGTSLRVHGLKVMVREFAKAVHAKGGKVVFVNYTKPPESSWGDVIDYWVQWDCDAWVSDLQEKIPKLWQTPEPPKLKKKRESSGAGEESEKTDAKRPVAAYPVALRDTKVAGAYWVPKIMKDLRRIAGFDPLEPREIVALPEIAAPVIAAPIVATPTEVPLPLAETPEPLTNKTIAIQRRTRRSRKSAPGALERSKKPPSTLNPNHGRTLRNAETPQPSKVEEPQVPFSHILRPEKYMAESSIIDSVKGRTRKRRRIDGEEVELPTAGRRQSGHKAAQMDSSLHLPPLKPQAPSPHNSPPHERLVPMEPPHTPTPKFETLENPKPYYVNTQPQPVSPMVMPSSLPLAQISHNTRPFTRSQRSSMGLEECPPQPVTGYPPEKSLGLYCNHQDSYSLVMKPGMCQAESDTLAALAMLKHGQIPEVVAKDFVLPQQRGVRTRSSSRIRESNNK